MLSGSGFRHSPLAVRLRKPVATGEEISGKVMAPAPFLKMYGVDAVTVSLPPVFSQREREMGSAPRDFIVAGYQK